MNDEKKIQEPPLCPQKILQEIVTAYNQGSWTTKKGMRVKLKALYALSPAYPNSGLLYEFIKEVEEKIST